MRLKRKFKTTLFFLLFGLALSASAQITSKYQADLGKIDSTGFYKINLQPAFVAKSFADFRDIRLLDQKGRFVPYISQSDLSKTTYKKFVSFPPVPASPGTDSVTTFIVENGAGQPISSLLIKLKNTDVKRWVNLSGSDDLQHWFAIEEELPLQGGAFQGDGTYSQLLLFPSSNYKYFKITINDKNKTRLKILEAGIMTEQSPDNRFTAIPKTTFNRKEINGTTLLTIQLNDNYLVNEIRLNVTFPKYYKREVMVYKSERYRDDLIADVELNSSENYPLLINAKTNRLNLKISNGDDPPLSITGVEIAQANQYIVSYLEAGKSYKLLTGDSAELKPYYDLRFFIDSIRGNLKEINHRAVVKNPAFEPSRKMYHIPELIWPAIIIALVILLLLTWRMAGEVNKKAKSTD